MSAFILTPIRFAASSYVLRIAVDGGSAVDVTINVTAGRDYWVSGDGQADGASGQGDLLEVIRSALDAAASGVTVERNALFRVEVGYAAGTIQVFWEHANTTLDPAVLGFEADTADAATVTGTLQPQGTCRPGCPTGFGRDMPVMVGGLARSIAGDVAGSYFGEAYPERSITLPAVYDTQVRQAAAKPGQPSGTLDRAWVDSMARGYPFRLYEDETELACSTYKATDPRSPWARHSRNPMYWSVTIPAVKILEYTPPPENSLDDPFGDWLGYWSAEQATGIGPYSWAATHGAGASALTCTAAYSGGEPTSPLLAAGLGATRVDGAVSYGASGFHSLSPTVVPSGALHIRVPPFKPSSESTGYWFAGVFNAPTDHITPRFASATSLVITWNSPTLATYTTTVTVTDGAWHFLDLVVRPTGGAAGVAAMDVFLNGSDLSPADHSVAMTVPINGRLGVGCWYSVGASPMSGALLGWGIRVATGIDFATHAAHAAALGV